MNTEKIKDQEVTMDQPIDEQQGNAAEEQSRTDNMTEESAADDNMTESAPKEENVDWKDRYIRLQAEFDNFRKRTLKEKMELVQIGSGNTVKNFLPVVDDMQRAIVAMEKSEDINALREGITLISNKLAESLKQCGVSEIEALDKELDTDYHEAVARFAAGEDKQGKIIDVVQSGYTMGDKVLRFAKVVVGE
ncbi:MAG: nucleotide exchange factor GrpE [Rikenellaceae bacterium]